MKNKRKNSDQIINDSYFLIFLQKRVVLWTLKTAPWVAFSSLGLLLIIFILVIVIKKEIIINMESKTAQSGISVPKIKQQDLEGDAGNITPAKFIPIKQKVLDQ